MTDWQGVVEVQFGTIVLADKESAERGLEGTSDNTLLWEQHCGALGDGIQVLVPERDEDVSTQVRVLESRGAIEPEWEQVAEVGLRVPTGRLVVFSWMVDEDLAGEVDVPTEPQIARIHWAGLDAWLADRSYRETGGPGPIRVRVDLAPGELEAVRTLREWQPWAPPVHESTRPDGLQVYRGVGADRRRQGLEPLPIRFWHPYPTIDEGSVTSMWRDPADGSRWADGSGGPWSHAFLRELSGAEADALAAQGFPPVRTYARDAAGRIWSADMVPLERASALLLIPPERWTMFQGLFTREEIEIVDLPAGWSRITRRPFGGAGSPVIVGSLDGDGNDALYQRWRDGAEIPT